MTGLPRKSAREISFPWVLSRENSGACDPAGSTAPGELFPEKPVGVLTGEFNFPFFLNQFKRCSPE
jgi:hypothetical protein